MGLQTKHTGKYVRIRDGKFFLGKDKESPYDELTGLITSITFRDDELEGTKIRKIVLDIEDDGETYIVSMPFDSGYASSLVNFLKNADLSKVLTLIPTSKIENDKPRNSMLIKQDGKFMKGYFTKDNPHGQPDFKKITKKSGKVEWDKEDFLEFRENVVINELQPQLGKTSKSTKVTEMVDAEEEVGDDLPF